MLNDGLRFLFLLVTGDEFPDLDEDLLRVLADAWDGAGRYLGEGPGPELRRLVVVIRSSFAGEAERAFAAMMAPLVAGPGNLVDVAAMFFRGVAEVLRDLALAVEYMKYVVIIELEMLQLELGWAFAVYGLFPEMMLWIQARIAMAARAVRSILEWLGWRMAGLGKVAVWGRGLLRGWGVSLGNQMVVTVGAQAAQFEKGTRSAWDGGYVRDGAVVGAFGGSLAPMARRAGHEVGDFLSEVLGRVSGAGDRHRAFALAVGHVVGESLHEGLTAMAANAALTREFTVGWADFTAGASSGVARVSGHLLGNVVRKLAVAAVVMHVGSRAARARHVGGGAGHDPGGLGGGDGFFGDGGGSWGAVPVPGAYGRHPKVLRGEGHDGHGPDDGAGPYDAVAVPAAYHRVPVAGSPVVFPGDGGHPPAGGGTGPVSAALSEMDGLPSGVDGSRSGADGVSSGAARSGLPDTGPRSRPPAMRGPSEGDSLTGARSRRGDTGPLSPLVPPTAADLGNLTDLPAATNRAAVGSVADPARVTTTEAPGEAGAVPVSPGPRGPDADVPGGAADAVLPTGQATGGEAASEVSGDVSSDGPVGRMAGVGPGSGVRRAGPLEAALPSEVGLDCPVVGGRPADGAPDGVGSRGEVHAVTSMDLPRGALAAKAVAPAMRPVTQQVMDQKVASTRAETPESSEVPGAGSEWGQGNDGAGSRLVERLASGVPPEVLGDPNRRRQVERVVCGTHDVLGLLRTGHYRRVLVAVAGRLPSGAEAARQMSLRLAGALGTLSPGRIGLRGGAPGGWPSGGVDIAAGSAWSESDVIAAERYEFSRWNPAFQALVVRIDADRVKALLEWAAGRDGRDEWLWSGVPEYVGRGGEAMIAVERRVRENPGTTMVVLVVPDGGAPGDIYRAAWESQNVVTRDSLGALADPGMVGFDVYAVMRSSVEHTFEQQPVLDSMVSVPPRDSLGEPSHSAGTGPRDVSFPHPDTLVAKWRATGSTGVEAALESYRLWYGKDPSPVRSVVDEVGRREQPMAMSGRLFEEAVRLVGIPGESALLLVGLPGQRERTFWHVVRYQAPSDRQDSHYVVELGEEGTVEPSTWLRTKAKAAYMELFGVVVFGVDGSPAGRDVPAPMRFAEDVFRSGSRGLEAVADFYLRWRGVGPSVVRDADVEMREGVWESGHGGAGLSRVARALQRHGDSAVVLTDRGGFLEQYWVLVRWTGPNYSQSQLYLIDGKDGTVRRVTLEEVVWRGDGIGTTVDAVVFPATAESGGGPPGPNAEGIGAVLGRAAKPGTQRHRRLQRLETLEAELRNPGLSDEEWQDRERERRELRKREYCWAKHTARRERLIKAGGSMEAEYRENHRIRDAQNYKRTRELVGYEDELAALGRPPGEGPDPHAIRRAELEGEIARLRTRRAAGSGVSTVRRREVGVTKSPARERVPGESGGEFVGFAVDSADADGPGAEVRGAMGIGQFGDPEILVQWLGADEFGGLDGAAWFLVMWYGELEKAVFDVTRDSAAWRGVGSGGTALVGMAELLREHGESAVVRAEVEGEQVVLVVVRYRAALDQDEAGVYVVDVRAGRARRWSVEELGRMASGWGRIEAVVFGVDGRVAPVGERDGWREHEAGAGLVEGRSREKASVLGEAAYVGGGAGEVSFGDPEAFAVEVFRRGLSGWDAAPEVYRSWYGAHRVLVGDLVEEMRQGRYFRGCGGKGLERALGLVNEHGESALVSLGSEQNGNFEKLWFFVGYRADPSGQLRRYRVDLATGRATIVTTTEVRVAGRAKPTTRVDAVAFDGDGGPKPMGKPVRKRGSKPERKAGQGSVQGFVVPGVAGSGRESTELRPEGTGTVPAGEVPESEEPVSPDMPEAVVVADGGVEPELPIRPEVGGDGPEPDRLQRPVSAVAVVGLVTTGTVGEGPPDSGEGEMSFADPEAFAVEVFRRGLRGWDAAPEVYGSWYGVDGSFVKAFVEELRQGTGFRGSGGNGLQRVLASAGEHGESALVSVGSAQGASVEEVWFFLAYRPDPSGEVHRYRVDLATGEVKPASMREMRRLVAARGRVDAVAFDVHGARKPVGKPAEQQEADKKRDRDRHRVKAAERRRVEQESTGVSRTWTG